nr:MULTISPECIES: ABC transporter ATP-binding protein [unclassified Bacteroides]
MLYVIFSGYRNRISLSFGRRISRSSEAANRDGILSAANLSIGYGKKVVASDINLRFEKGELVCLLGRNGAGKSTLLRTLSGFLKPIKGSVFLKETDINKLSFRQISKFIGVVLTDKVQVDNITVEQVVSFGRQPHTGYFGRLSNRDKEIVGEMIAKVGLAYKQHSYFSDLSDGERQKTMIAKALTQECEVLILDEPTAFLDEQSQLDIMLLLKHIAHNEHKLVILSTHQSALANEHADRIVKI